MLNSARRHFILSWLFALILIGSNLALCADSQPRNVAYTSFTSSVRVILYEPIAGQWLLSTFAQAKPGSELYFRGDFYRVVDSEQAQIIPNVNIGGMFEADRPYDSASRSPKSGDVVQVLAKDSKFASHAVFGKVQPGVTIRFQGREYKVADDRRPVDTGGVVYASASSLQRIDITRGAMQHIIDRHTVGGSMNSGKSTFNPDENIQTLIKNAELLVPVNQERGNCQRIFEAGRAIGVDRRSGKLTSTYTVITTQSGKLVTAFPGLP